MSWVKALEILGFLVGLLYLWWEYHANWRLWYASIAMPLISMCLYFSKGIYADFAINIYYLVISVYGYIVWTRGRTKAPSQSSFPADASDASDASSSKNDVSDASSAKKDSSQEGVAISNIPMRYLAWCAVVFVLLWGAMYWVLANLTDSTVPIPDSFTTALSIIGMWMLSRKYLQQWFVWIAVDAVCVALYAYKGLPLYSLLYAAYTVIAVFGFIKWRRLMKNDNSLINPNNPS